MYVHIYIYIYIHTIVYIYIYILIFTSPRICIYTYTHTAVHILIYTSPRICIYIYIYIHIYTHTYTYTHMHILIFTSPELDTCMKFREVVKAHQQHSVAKLITHAHGHPLLCSYTNDATSLRTKVRFVNPGRKTATLPLVREGTALREYLLERSFFNNLDKDGVAVPQVIITDLRVLSEGKTSWNLYTAAELSSPHLKSRGHTGSSISQLLF